MIRRTYFAEVRETPRKHENSKKEPILGVPGFLQYEICESPLYDGPQEGMDKYFEII